MLSTSAFNALLKTLEEPPEHVKFIFATTEIRKVPVTVLSPLPAVRPAPDRTGRHDRTAAPDRHRRRRGDRDDALALITRAAEGSARDATSLLDQAISHGAGETSADQVRAMLGLADRGRVLDLMDMILRGDAAAALTGTGRPICRRRRPAGGAARSGGDHPLGLGGENHARCRRGSTVSPR